MRLFSKHCNSAYRLYAEFALRTNHRSNVWVSISSASNESLLANNYLFAKVSNEKSIAISVFSVGIQCRRTRQFGAGLAKSQ